jgi:acetyl esterase/lipase
MRSLLIALFCVLAMVPPVMATDYNELLSRDRPTANYRFAYGNQPEQFGELWLPGTSGTYPVVIMIHGGCWQSALPGLELMDYIADDLRRSGIAVWNIEYRRLGDDGGGYPGTFLDVANGVDYMRQIAPAYNLDLSRVVIMGHSAGGHLGLWAAARRRISPESPLYSKYPLPVKTVITLAGINDLAAYRARGSGACGEPGVIDQLIDAPGHTGPSAYADTSPAALLPIGVKQIVVYGGLDPIVDSAFGRNYAKLAQNAGDKAKTLDIPGAGHFELIDPQSGAWGQIKRALFNQFQ